MSRTISTGIDIGTHQVKVVIAESSRESDRYAPKIIGIGFAESKGLRHGYIINRDDTIRSIRQAVRAAEKMAEVSVKKACIAIGGIGLSGTTSVGSVIISRADSEITDLDVEKVIASAKAALPQNATLNRRILHTIPTQFKIDGKQVLGRPLGLKASRLEVRVLFIICMENHVDDLLDATEEVGIGISDVVAAPVAASVVTLTKTQKIAGVVLANIGSETASIIVYENNLPISLEVFPIGSNEITNDIALGLKIPLEEAEDVKVGRLIGVSYPRKKLDEIIEARLSDIFELIEAHLKKINKNGLLPAGIVLTGGGSGIETIDDFAKAALRLPSRVASMTFSDKIKSQIKDASWSVAYGLCIIGLTEDDGASPGREFVRRTVNKFRVWLKQFLP